MVHLTLALLLWKSPSQQALTIQLADAKTRSFAGWSLRLDSGDAFLFDAQGKAQLSIPEDSASFEIWDAKRQVRFFGLWSQYAGQATLEINVAGKGLNLHQVVSASRMQQSQWETPAEVNVIRPDEMEERSAIQTSDWLKEQSEVLLQKTNLGGGSPIMRGMSGNRVLLMVDGFRLNNAIFRLGLNQYLNTVPGGQLEQIEVLSGPSGVQYGSDGLGGTIHLRSADPASITDKDQLIYSGLASSADGSNTHRVSGHASFDDFFVQGHIQFNNFANLEAGGSVGAQIPTGYESWDGSLNLTYKLSEERRLRLINTNSSASNVPRTDRIQSGRDLLWEYDPQKLRIHGLRFENKLDASWADFMDLGLGYLRQDEGTRRISTGSPDRLSVDRAIVDTLQFNGTFTKVAPRAQWVYGFDFQSDALDTGAERIDLPTGAVAAIQPKFPGDAAYRSFGAFVTADIELTPIHRLKAGARQSTAELEGTLGAPIGAVNERYEKLTPSLVWHMNLDQYFVSAGVSQGFRAPNLEDALALGPSNSGFDAPNPNLSPEELWSYELNFRWRDEKQLIQASLYTSRYEDLIERVPGSYQGADTFDGEPVFILDNVGEAKVDGLSLKYQHRLNERFNISTDASWTRGEQTDRNEPMRRIPPLRGNLSASYERGPLSLTGHFTWADRQDRLSSGDIADNRIPDGGTPGYGVLHFRGRYRLMERVTINLSLENVFDKLYKHHGSGVFEPGRRLLLELQAKWK